LTRPLNSTTALPPAKILRLQEVIGVLLFHARAINSTLLVALGTLVFHRKIHQIYGPRHYAVVELRCHSS
jgi:hypothetical protein